MIRTKIKDYFHAKYNVLPSRVMTGLVWCFADVNGPKLIYMDEITKDVFTSPRTVGDRTWDQLQEMLASN
jgi:hypothetical protein